jgi:anion-transporting  ArsA/GET3 family ATPase
VSTNLTVIVGGGGVGKTTVAAALALARARTGARALVITVDPARRLADALGVHVGIESAPVRIDGVELYARMPDARRSVDLFADWLFAEERSMGDRVRANPLYRELADALVGMHEMVSVAIVNQELETGGYDEVVLDTAPTRHALEFLDYPARLVDMLEARTVRWIAAMAAHSGVSLEGQPRNKGLAAWGKRRIQALLGKVAGTLALGDVSALFAELIAVRERWLGLLLAVEQRLASAETRYLVVTTPSGAAIDDADYLLLELHRRGRHPSRILVNRVVESLPAWLTQVQPVTDPCLAAVQRAYLAEYRARVLQSQRARERLAATTDVPLTLLPALRTTDPRVILTGLADALAGLSSR